MDVSCGVPKTPAVKAASVCCGAAEGFHTKDVKTEGKQVPKHACFFPFFLKQAGLLEEKLNSWLCLHFLGVGTPVAPTVGCPGPSLSLGRTEHLSVRLQEWLLEPLPSLPFVTCKDHHPST